MSGFWDQAFAPGGTVTLSYGGSATSGVDYTPASTTISIPSNPNPFPGFGSTGFSVELLADNLVEPAETLVVSLAGATEGLVLRPYAMPVGDPTPYETSTVTIADDPPTVYIGHYGPNGEGNGMEEYEPGTSTPQPLRFTLSRAGGDLSQPLSVSYGIAGSGSNPADGEDYSSSGSSLTLSGTSAVLEIAVQDDDQIEAALEGVTVTLSGGGMGSSYLIGAGSSEGTIQDNDWEIDSASVSFDDQGVIPDPGTVYTSPQWSDHDGDGSPSTEAGEAQPAPLSYWRSIAGQAHYITAMPAFTLGGNPVSGWYHIAGTGPGGGRFEGDVQLQRNDTGSLHFVSGSFRCTQELPAVITKGADLAIDWEIKRVGPQPQTKVYGSSNNKLYVTGADCGTQYETVLNLGCTGADGFRPAEAGELEPGATAANQQVADGIWGQFSDNSTKRADGTVMKYNHDPDTGSTAAAMIQDDEGRGRCTSWAELFVLVLRAEGVGATSIRMLPKAGYQFLQVAAGPAQGTSGANYSGTCFNFHQVVQVACYPDRIYDPSYGGSPVVDAVDVKLKYEDLHVVGYWHAYLDSTGEWVLLNPRTDDVKGGSSELVW